MDAFHARAFPATIEAQKQKRRNHRYAGHEHEAVDDASHRLIPIMP